MVVIIILLLFLYHSVAVIKICVSQKELFYFRLNFIFEKIGFLVFFCQLVFQSGKRHSQQKQTSCFCQRTNDWRQRRRRAMLTQSLAPGSADAVDVSPYPFPRPNFPLQRQQCPLNSRQLHNHIPHLMQILQQKTVIVIKDRKTTSNAFYIIVDSWMWWQAVSWVLHLLLEEQQIHLNVQQQDGEIWVTTATSSNALLGRSKIFSSLLLRLEIKKIEWRWVGAVWKREREKARERKKERLINRATERLATNTERSI